MSIPTTNTPYFGNFPRFRYDVNYGGYPVTEDVTDIFFRIGMIKEVLKNVTAYYAYEIKDGDTPDVLANKMYGDSGAGWIILYANNMFDPQWDWPLDYRTFNTYIENKYGSVDIAKINIHHYEKVVTRTVNGTTNVTRYTVDEKRLTQNLPSIPYSYYYPYPESSGLTTDSSLFTSDNTTLYSDSDYDYNNFVGSLTVGPEYDTFEIDGTTVIQEISRNAVTYYDYEQEINENKRMIKLIKSEYYEGLITEFYRKTFEAKNYDVDSSLYISNYIRRLTV